LQVSIGFGGLPERVGVTYQTNTTASTRGAKKSKRLK